MNGTPEESCQSRFLCPP